MLVHHKCWYRHLAEQFTHVQVPGGLEITIGGFGCGRLALPLGKFLKLLLRCPWHEQRREQLTKCRSLLAPSGADQGRQSLSFLQLELVFCPAICSPRETTVKDKVTHPFGMPHGKSNRYGATLRHPE